MVSADDWSVDMFESERREAARIFLDGRERAEADTTPTADAASGVGGAASMISAALVRVELVGGETLFDDLDSADALFVVTSGRLRVHRNATVLAEILPGQIVGERALLTGEPRRGSVTAVRDSVLYRLERADFDRFCLAHPAVMRNMLTMLARRIGEKDEEPVDRPVPANLVIVPVGSDRSGDGSAAQFADRLVTFLDRVAPSTLITERRIDDEVGAGAAQAPDGSATGDEVRRRLRDLEATHAHLVAVGQSEPTPWTRRLLRQADMVLLVGVAGRPGTPSPTEAWLAESNDGLMPTCHLVIVEPRSDRTPSGTRRWLAGRDPDGVHHVDPTEDAHLARLVRSIADMPSALVLSGGASRGLAHIGVLRALDEHGHPIDAVSGTSAGSMIGAMLAMGWDSARIRAALDRVLVSQGRRLLDPTLPFTSLVGGRRFTDAVDDLFGEIDIEDLWLTYLCLTTDLTAATGRIHRSGPLRRAVRASCSVPLLMPPVVDDGHLLVDGAVMNNTPVDPLLEVTGVSALVVVNVTEAFFTADEPYNYDSTLPLRRVLSGRFNPFSEKLVAPRLIDILLRSLEIGSKSIEEQQFDKADLYVRPDATGFGYTDVASVDAVIDVGYQAAVRAIEETGLPSVPYAPA